MIKSRVEAINGSLVRAGGKWLRCIGNKSFNVGDCVFNDGRCAFGNFHEAQQPLIIPLYDETVPIITVNNGISSFYSFDNKRLRTLISPEFSSDIVAYSIFSNDSNRNVVVSSNPDVCAINLHDNGDIFKIREKKNEDNKLVAIEIIKNDVVVNLIDITSFENDTLNYAHSHYFPVETVAVSYQEFYTTNSIVFWAFIEDDTHWAFLFQSAAVEVTFYDNNSLIRPSFGYEDFGTSAMVFHVFVVSSDGSSLISSILHPMLPTLIDLINVQHINRDRPDSPFYFDSFFSVKYPLSKDFYYQMSKIYQDGSGNVDFNVFSSNDKLLFSGTAGYVSKLSLVKLKKGFLFAVNSSAEWKTDNPSNTYFDSGVYLFNGKLWQKIIDEPCINQRLKAMKKIKGWEKRIQFI